jgi:pyrroline-5-carboxylate reductase
MNTFGFIGFGNMARMIIKCLIKYADIKPQDIYATRADTSRLDEIVAEFEGVNAVASPIEIVERARLIFLCAKPDGIRAALTVMSPFAKSETHFVSLAVVLPLDELDGIYKGKITKYMPTVASETAAGISLINHNARVNADDAAYIEGLIGKFSRVKRIREEDWGFASILTSCMPGFIASVSGHFAEAASRHTGSLSLEEISGLLTGTLYGTAKLLNETGASYAQVVDRVATKGGITREGVNVFDRTLPAVFDEVFDRALQKINQAAEVRK